VPKPEAIVKKNIKKFAKAALEEHRKAHLKRLKDIRDDAEEQLKRRARDDDEREYAESLEIEERGNKISIISNPKGKTGRQVEQIARGMEFGFKGRPAFPFWRKAQRKAT